MWISKSSNTRNQNFASEIATINSSITDKRGVEIWDLDFTGYKEPEYIDGFLRVYVSSTPSDLQFTENSILVILNYSYFIVFCKEITLQCCNKFKKRIKIYSGKITTLDVLAAFKHVYPSLTYELYNDLNSTKQYTIEPPSPVTETFGGVKEVDVENPDNLLIKGYVKSGYFWLYTISPTNGFIRFQPKGSKVVQKFAYKDGVLPVIEDNETVRSLNEIIAYLAKNDYKVDLKVPVKKPVNSKGEPGTETQPGAVKQQWGF